MDQNSLAGSANTGNETNKSKGEKLLPPEMAIPICWFCKHFHSPEKRKVRSEGGKTFTCKAFPEAIPGEILRNNFDHRMPHPDDNDIQFALYETWESVWGFLDRLSDDAKKEWVSAIFDHLDILRKDGLALPPLVEDENHQVILDQLLQAKQYSVYPLPYIHAPYFPPSLIEKLIRQVRKDIERNQNQNASKSDLEKDK